MHISARFSAVALLAFAPSAWAVGSASVTNNCGYPIWYAAIAGTAEPMQALNPGASMSLTYDLPNTGVSIKLAMNNSESGPLTQFEYTWAAGKINYDLSNINGYPFSTGGMAVTPSMSNDPNNPTCVPIVCPAGSAVCSAAYNQPDDTRTMVCSDAASINLSMCGGGSAKRDVHIHPRTHTRQIRHPHARVWVSV